MRHSIGLYDRDSNALVADLVFQHFSVDKINTRCVLVLMNSTICFPPNYWDCAKIGNEHVRREYVILYFLFCKPQIYDFTILFNVSFFYLSTHIKEMNSSAFLSIARVKVVSISPEIRREWVIMVAGTEDVFTINQVTQTQQFIAKVTGWKQFSEHAKKIFWQYQNL